MEEKNESGEPVPVGLHYGTTLVFSSVVELLSCVWCLSQYGRRVGNLIIIFRLFFFLALFFF